MLHITRKFELLQVLMEKEFPLASDFSSPTISLIKATLPMYKKDYSKSIELLYSLLSSASSDGISQQGEIDRIFFSIINGLL